MLHHSAWVVLDLIWVQHTYIPYFLPVYPITGLHILRFTYPVHSTKRSHLPPFYLSMPETLLSHSHLNLSHSSGLIRNVAVWEKNLWPLSTPKSYKILYCLSLHIFQFIYLDFAIPQSPMMPDRKQEGWWSRHQSRKMCEFHILWCKQHLASRIVIVMVQIAWLENLCTACQNSSTTVGSTHETVRRNTEATGSHPQVKEDDEIGGNLTVDPNNRFHLATQNFNKAG